MTTTEQLQRGMLAVVTRLQNRLQPDERGAAMSEYGILIFFVGIAAFGVLVLFGGEVWELFRSTEEGFDNARKVPPAAD